jgi:hypothetical protein
VRLVVNCILVLRLIVVARGHVKTHVLHASETATSVTVVMWMSHRRHRGMPLCIRRIMCHACLQLVLLQNRRQELVLVVQHLACHSALSILRRHVYLNVHRNLNHTLTSVVIVVDALDISSATARWHHRIDPPVQL